MKNLNCFLHVEKVSRVIHYLKICSIRITHMAPSGYGKELYRPGGISSNLWSAGAEFNRVGIRRWYIVFIRTFLFCDLSTKGRISGLILGLSLIFTGAFGSFNIDVAPEKRKGPYAELISSGYGEISIARDFVNLRTTTAYRVPFILRRNLILIEAIVDGKTGLLLLDSGMDHVVLNQNHFKGEPDGKYIIGVMDDMEHSQQKYVSMTIGELPTHTQYAFIADLNHFEQFFHAEILGVCGVDYLQQFQWVIHYQQHFIDFYPLSKSGDVLDHSLLPPNEILRLLNEAHLLIVKVRSEGHTMNLALDTGSSSTILDKDNKTSLTSQHGNLEQLQHTSRVTGINGKGKLITSFVLSNLRVESTLIPPLQVSFVPLTRIIRRRNINLDGIFNPIFLCHSIIGINWKKKRLYVWHYHSKSQEAFAGNLDQ